MGNCLDVFHFPAWYNTKLTYLMVEVCDDNMPERSCNIAFNVSGDATHLWRDIPLSLLVCKAVCLFCGAQQEEIRYGLGE